MSFLILGHRGFSAQYPENTIVAFRKAIEYGADGLELDIRASKDQQVIVIHDEDIQRVANRTGKIRDMNVHQIKEVRVKGIEPIPTLEEVFGLMPVTGFLNVEIKEREVLAPLIRLLKKTSVSFKLVFSSFHHEYLEELRRELPDVKIGLLIGDEIKKATSFSDHLRHLISTFRPYSLHLPVQIFSTVLTLVSADDAVAKTYTAFVDSAVSALRSIKEEGLKLYWWTVDDILLAEFLKDHQILDGLITNQVERMVQKYKSRDRFAKNR